MRWLYTFLLYWLTPLILLRLLWRSRELPDYRRRWAERFGWVRPSPAPIAVWVHAVSVGESLAAMPLIRALVDLHGEGAVWVTTTTPTGSARVTETLGARVRHSYAPYDLPGSVARFLRRVRPQCVVVMETELWPNLFHQLGAAGTPLIVANARLSPRSMRGYSRVRGFAQSTLAAARIAAQSAADAERFRQLGAQHVTVMGNIKFDLSIDEAQIRAGHDLRRRIGAQRPVWVAASTHEGEEDIALRAHAELRRAYADALLILVPRHPQRFDTVARRIAGSGLAMARRASGDDPSAAAVLLGDTMGEIFVYYAAADLAVVGGSFVDIGGHNVLEPASIGLPVLFGPQMHNFLPARDLLLQGQAAIGLDEPVMLVPTLHALLADPERRARMGAAGRDAVQANRGALQTLLGLIADPSSLD